MLTRRNRYTIKDTRHVKDQINRRFKRYGIQSGWVIQQVHRALSTQNLNPGEIYWIRIANFTREVWFPASTADGAVNGDTLYAVVRWFEDFEYFGITTVLLRRSGQSVQCDKLFDAPELTTIRT